MTIQESAQQTAALGAKIAHDFSQLDASQTSIGESIEQFQEVTHGLDEMSSLFADLGSETQAAKCSAASDHASEIEQQVESAKDKIQEAMSIIDATMASLEQLLTMIHGIDEGAM